MSTAVDSHQKLPQSELCRNGWAGEAATCGGSCIAGSRTIVHKSSCSVTVLDRLRAISTDPSQHVTDVTLELYARYFQTPHLLDYFELDKTKYYVYSG